LTVMSFSNSGVKLETVKLESCCPMPTSGV
jgi:hypothetical protein